MADTATLDEVCLDPCPDCCLGDIDESAAQLLLEDAIRTYDAQTAEVAANEEATRMVVTAAGATKFKEIGPIESVANEVILLGAKKAAGVT